MNVIYSDPRVAVTTYGVISTFFNLTRRTKQRDPLSPLLFTLFLEPLATTIGEEIGIKAVLQGEEEHTIFLYADNILLHVNDPILSIPSVLSIIES